MPPGIGYGKKVKVDPKSKLGKNIKKDRVKIKQTTQDRLDEAEGKKKGKMKFKVVKKSEEPKKKPIKFNVKKEAQSIVSSFNFDQIVDSGDNSLLNQVYENFIHSGVGDISWIKGITPKMAEFYSDNVGNYEDLNKKDKARQDKIEEKVNENVHSSLYVEIEKDFKQWKKENKGKKMTEKQAVKSFGGYANII